VLIRIAGYKICVYSPQKYAQPEGSVFCFFTCLPDVNSGAEWRTPVLVRRHAIRKCMHVHIRAGAASGAMVSIASRYTYRINGAESVPV
jgi:hypothetical protein